jgi:hypothetical protein
VLPCEAVNGKKTKKGGAISTSYFHDKRPGSKIASAAGGKGEIVMLHLGTSVMRYCAGLSRRQVLQVGGLSLLGLSLPDLFRRSATAAATRREISCIFLWLDGGPSHLETFDPKPNTSDAVRGPYGATRTNVSGVYFSELLPQLAQRMDRCAIVRSLNHKVDAHAPIPMLTGFPGVTTSYGAVVTKFKGAINDMPPYVHLGSKLGVGGGALGSVCDPVEVRDPSGKQVELPQFNVRADIGADRLLCRKDLLQSVDRLREELHDNRTIEQHDAFVQRAVDMLTSTRVREAFDLSREKDDLRERYGANFFGQSCLLARRLVQAGTRFVQIKWYDGPAFDGWDVHGADLAGMARMEQHLCPRFDQGLSALLDDLKETGLLKTTLVIAVGEFGRTPKINKYGARDHWPYCFSALLAGGGVPGGTVVGASDREGGYPTDRPVGPPDLAATIYRLMGIDTNTDPRVRPFIKEGAPISELF